MTDEPNPLAVMPDDRTLYRRLTRASREVALLKKLIRLSEYAAARGYTLTAEDRAPVQRPPSAA